MMWLTIDYNDIDYDNDADLNNDAMDDDNDATDDAIDTEQWADLVLRWAVMVGGRLSLWGSFDPTGAL